MKIQVLGADYSETGLGKVPYVSPELNALLTIYTSISQTDKSNVQAFINDIGGLDGDIYGKAFHIILPMFSTNAVEGTMDLKTGVRNFTNTGFNTGNLAGKYSIIDEALYQESISGFGDSSINNELPISAISGAFAFLQNPSYVKQNYVTATGLGNFMAAGNNVIQKYDGTNNQRAESVRNVIVANNVVSFSGQAGNTSGTRNKLFADADTSDFDMVALSGNSKMSIGASGDSSTFNLQGLRVAVYCNGLTVSETQTLHTALGNLMSKY